MTIFNDTQDLVKMLTDAGIRAVADPRRVDPPCVLVVPQSADFDTNCLGEGTTVWGIHVLAGSPSGLEAMKNLSAMTAKTLAAIPGIQEVRLSSYSTDDGVPWPSFELTLRTVSGWA